MTLRNRIVFFPCTGCICCYFLNIICCGSKGRRIARCIVRSRRLRTMWNMTVPRRCRILHLIVCRDERIILLCFIVLFGKRRNKCLWRWACMLRTSRYLCGMLLRGCLLDLSERHRGRFVFFLRCMVLHVFHMIRFRMHRRFTFLRILFLIWHGNLRFPLNNILLYLPHQPIILRRENGKERENEQNNP